MQVGFNYAWSHNRDGAQIGPNPWASIDEWTAHAKLVAAGGVSRIPLPPLFDHIDANLWYLKAIGVSVVRWFLLGNGFNYGPPSKDSPRLAPGFRSGKLGEPTEPGRSFDPPSQIDTRFTRDFEELLVRFKRAELQIIPSLIDFEFGSSLKWTVDPVRGIGARGKVDIITDPRKKKVFFDTMLVSLLGVSKKYREQIYAWELINEPVWLCLKFGPLSAGWWSERVPEATFAQMSDFLEEGTARINDYKFASTVGHRFRADLDRLPTGSLPQFHYYAKSLAGTGISLGPYKFDPPGIRGQHLFQRDPKPILGEFDSDLNRFGQPWAGDLGNKDSTFSRLNLLQLAGCELALLWPDYGPGDEAVIGTAVKDKTRFAEERQICVDYDIVKLLGPTREAIAQFWRLRSPKKTEWARDKRCGSTPGCEARIARSVGI
jgi:hypothetical protein